MSDIQIIHGDCRDVMRAMPDLSVDAIVTDPPYGTQADKDGYGRRYHGEGIGRFIENDADLSAMAGMLGEASRVLKPNSWLAVFCSPKRHAEAASILERAGFPVGGEVIWDKASPGLGGGIRYQHETILLAGHGKPSGNASLFSVIREHLSRTGSGGHPHEKPVRVMRELVQYCCPESGVVLDPFAGSGTTAVACMKSGRRCIAVELDPRYIPCIKKRTTKAETPLFNRIGAES